MPGSPVENWRGKAIRYRLVAETCGECGETIFPPRDICPGCNSNQTGGDLIRKAILNPEVLNRTVEK